MKTGVVPTVELTKTADYTPENYICYVKDETGWSNTKLYAWATDQPKIFGDWATTIAFTPETEVIGGTTYKKYPFSESDGSFEFIFSDGGSEKAGSRVVTNGYTADRNYYITLTTSSATTDKTTVNVKATKEFSTYCNTDNLDFTGISGLEAYRVSEVTESAAKIAQVTTVPGGQGLVLKKTENIGVATTFEVPVLASAESIGDNALVGVTTDTDITGVAHAYILSDGLFYKSSGGTLAAGKAYLVAAAWDGSSANSFSMIVDDSDTDGIKSIENRELRNENSDYYNLAGQKVGKDYKGIVIVNGKKMLNK